MTRFLDWWLTPRATSRDEAFRERVIRSTLLIVILLAILSSASTFFIFQSQWGLVSYPSLHIAGLALCFLSAFAVSQGRVLISGWVLVITVLFGVSGVVLIARQEASIIGVLNGISAFMLVPVIATLLLPLTYILPISLVSVLIYSIVQFFIPIGDLEISGFTADRQIMSVFILFLIEGLLLRQLRTEFDARLETLRISIIEAERSREQAEAAHKQAEADRQRAEDADRAKSQFLANMSHELRTPLNAIIGYDEAMIGGMVGEFTTQQMTILGHIQHNSRRLLTLINDILDLSKIESGSLEIYLSPMSPRKVIEKTAESLQSLADETGITLAVRLDETVPEVVLCDARKLEQILVNLLSNAIKFTSEGGVEIKVDMADTENWRMQVIDTGVGIPDDSLQSIFEPFQQVDGTATRKYKGTGLGLAITKSLTEKMGGTLSVESELEKGSTFTVVLPRVNVPSVDDDVALIEDR